MLTARDFRLKLHISTKNFGQIRKSVYLCTRKQQGSVEKPRKRPKQPKDFRAKFAGIR